MSNKVLTRTTMNLRCVARFFVCGDALHSRRSRESLRRLRDIFPHVEFKVEVIDVGETPQTALDRGIFVNPALQVLEFASGMLICGDFSDFTALAGMFPKGESDA